MSKSSAIITLDQADPTYGSQISFTTDPDDQVINLQCYRDDDMLVYSDSRHSGDLFTLASLAWTEGPAHCEALVRALRSHRVVTIGSIEFEVKG